ncbi:MAG TPA: hypothetical protein VKT49_20240 [Bryobacteraceae bacterium]|nr:hypothetical protein [Bryobacteraceae bacterium]
MRRLTSAILFALVLAHGQGRAPQTPKAAAPIDLTGYWVSVVTEDWRFRMMTPAKGDFPSIPLNPEGRKVALAWDPAKDESAGEACKGYGAGNILRMPGRLHITWQDENTLKVETDTGQQTRLFHFGRQQPPSTPPDWQGFSVAQWEFAGGRGRGAGGVRGGDLKVITTHVRPGYLQKNGVPYSGDAVITEHFDALEKEANGDQWLIVTTLVDDPQYLNQPFQRSTHFKRQPDAAGWDPEPCIAR